MSRKLATLACLAVAAAALAVPAGASAKGGLVGSLAASQCAAEKAERGKKQFRKRYAPKAKPGKAMVVCIKRARPAVRRAVASATADCNAEMAEYGPEIFYEDWTSFTECVEYYADGYLNGGFEEEDPGEDGEEEEEDPDF